MPERRQCNADIALARALTLGGNGGIFNKNGYVDLSAPSDATPATPGNPFVNQEAALPFGSPGASRLVPSPPSPPPTARISLEHTPVEHAELQRALHEATAAGQLSAPSQTKCPWGLAIRA